MPFSIDGQSHANGIKNEKFVVDFFNKNPNNEISKFLESEYSTSIISCTHEGGTQQQMDASFQLSNGTEIGVSIKNHKKGGTIDWVNTTKGVSDDLKKDILEFKEKNQDKPVPKKGGIRSELDDIMSSRLDDLSSEEISGLLEKNYKKEEVTRYIIFNINQSKQLILLDKSNLDIYFNPIHKNDFILKSTSRAKTSRQIWIKTPDGKEINTNLRLRLLLNNGISALLGQSKKNKSSCACFKIQQDKVDEFIKGCFGKVIVNY